jgi:hypothetical protein
MPRLELTRSKHDRRLYELGGLGTLRLEGFWSRSATATAAGVTWRFARAGFFGRTINAVQGSSKVGEFQSRSIRRGGDLTWNGRAFELRPASAWRERYALAVGDDEVALFDGKDWGKRPVAIEIVRPEAVEPGLLLFVAFVVRSLAEDTAAVGASVATTGGV